MRVRSGRFNKSANAPQDHLAARELLETGRSVDPALACNPGVALNAHL